MAAASSSGHQPLAIPGPRVTSKTLKPLAELEEEIVIPPFVGWKARTEDKDSSSREDCTPTKSPKQLHTEWTAWLQENEPTKQAQWVELRARTKARGEFSFNDMWKQGNLYLRRGDLDIISIERMIQPHPMLAIGCMKRLTNKVNSKAPKNRHASPYDIRFMTVLGWRVTMGYSRYGDQGDTTHFWTKFGFNCSDAWQHKMMSDLMLHFAGYESLYGYPHGSHWRPKLPAIYVTKPVAKPQAKWRVKQPQPAPPPTPPPLHLLQEASQPLAQLPKDGEGSMVSDVASSQPLAQLPEDGEGSMVNDVASLQPLAQSVEEGGINDEDEGKDERQEEGSEQDKDLADDEETEPASEQDEDLADVIEKEQQQMLEDALKTHPSTWSVAEVIAFFQDLKMEEFVEEIKWEGMDGEVLVGMNAQDWAESFGMSQHEVDYILNAIESLPAIGGPAPVVEKRKMLTWAEAQEEDSDVADDEIAKVEVGCDEDTRDLEAQDAEASEAEELRFMARVRETKRKHAAQKFRPTFFLPPSSSPYHGDQGLLILRKQPLALSILSHCRRPCRWGRQWPC